MVIGLCIDTDAKTGFQSYILPYPLYLSNLHTNALKILLSFFVSEIFQIGLVNIHELLKYSRQNVANKDHIYCTIYCM